MELNKLFGSRRSHRADTPRLTTTGSITIDGRELQLIEPPAGPWDGPMGAVQKAVLSKNERARTRETHISRCLAEMGASEEQCSLFRDSHQESKAMCRLLCGNRAAVRMARVTQTNELQFVIDPSRLASDYDPVHLSDLCCLLAKVGLTTQARNLMHAVMRDMKFTSGQTFRIDKAAFGYQNLIKLGVPDLGSILVQCPDIVDALYSSSPKESLDLLLYGLADPTCSVADRDSLVLRCVRLLESVGLPSIELRKSPFGQKIPELLVPSCARLLSKGLIGTSTFSWLITQLPANALMPIMTTDLPPWTEFIKDGLIKLSWKDSLTLLIRGKEDPTCSPTDLDNLALHCVRWLESLPPHALRKTPIAQWIAELLVPPCASLLSKGLIGTAMFSWLIEQLPPNAQVPITTKDLPLWTKLLDDGLITQPVFSWLTHSLVESDSTKLSVRIEVITESARALLKQVKHSPVEIVSPDAADKACAEFVRDLQTLYEQALAAQDDKQIEKIQDLATNIAEEFQNEAAANLVDLIVLPALWEKVNLWLKADLNEDGTTYTIVPKADANEVVDAGVVQRFVSAIALLPGRIPVAVMAAYIEYGHAKWPGFFKLTTVVNLWASYAGANPAYEDAAVRALAASKVFVDNALEPSHAELLLHVPPSLVEMRTAVLLASDPNRLHDEILRDLKFMLKADGLPPQWSSLHEKLLFLMLSRVTNRAGPIIQLIVGAWFGSNVTTLPKQSLILLLTQLAQRDLTRDQLKSVARTLWRLVIPGSGKDAEPAYVGLTQIFLEVADSKSGLALLHQVWDVLSHMIVPTKLTRDGLHGLCMTAGACIAVLYPDNYLDEKTLSLICVYRGLCVHHKQSHFGNSTEAQRAIRYARMYYKIAESDALGQHWEAIFDPDLYLHQMLERLESD